MKTRTSAPQRQAADRSPQPARGRRTGASEHTQAPLGGGLRSNQALQRLADIGVRPKLDVSTPGDAYEREADELAGQVMRTTEPEQKKPEPTAKKRPEEGLKRAADDERKGERKDPSTTEPKKDDESLRRRVDDEKRTPKEKRPDETVKRAAEEEPRRDREDATETLRARSESASTPVVPDAMESWLGGTKGGGEPLSPRSREFFEPRFGRDLGDVRIHSDAGAARAASEINARAFTHGRDIYFGSGRYQPETTAGRHLIAHELAHTMQQPASVGRRLHRQEEASGAAGPDVFEVPKLELPPIKSRHHHAYEGWAASGRLQRHRGYDRTAEGSPGQQGEWLRQVPLPAAAVLQRLDLDLGNPVAKEISVNDKKITLPSSIERLEQVLRIPNWDRDGNPNREFQVDHIVELQVAGWPGKAEGNQLANMELLDQRSNASAGGSTRYGVRDSVEKELQRRRTEAGGTAAPVTSADVTEVLTTKQVVFRGVSGGDRGRRSEGDSRWWTLEEIKNSVHLANAKPLRNIGEAGKADSLALVSPARTSVLGEYAHGAEQLTIPVTDPVQQTRIAGLRITSIQLDPGYTTVTGTGRIGCVTAEWNLPQGVHPGTPEVTVDLQRHSQYSGFLGNLPGFGGSIEGASPVEFSPPRIESAQVVAEGQLRPTIPLLGSRPIDLRLVGRDLELSYLFDIGQLSLPIPGLTIDDSSLMLFFGTRGLGAEGAVDFSIRELGSGRLTAAIGTEQGFEASGRFLFDTDLFDRAEIEVWYRESAFGGRGTLGIDTPNKVRGVRSAEITAGYDRGTFSATGRVAPAVPGVQEATLAVSYGEETGLSIAATLALGEGIPGIHGGALEAQVQRRPEAAEYELRAHGTVRPAIPGVDAAIDVNYADGAFTARGTASYQRGMLSGSLEVGATNRVLGEDGSLTDEVGEELRAFGGGDLTVRIAPWLQGTAGVRILPNAEIELRGEIALPEQIEIFPRKQVDKSLFSIAVQAPIFPGIVAEIGGGASAQAGIGPGVIDQMRLGIVYNPAREQETHVTGDARMNVPTDAGLRLAVRAGIGLGITGASATGGLEIGGLLGIGGAADAAVHIDWMPSSGLAIDAVGDLHAEPKFRFDISGYVSVRALGFSVYDNRWQLGSYEFGSNLRFGARFPIHYAEGEPFDISLDDVEFTVPEIDPRQLLSGLVDEIA